MLAAPDYRFTNDAEHYVTTARDIASGRILGDSHWLHDFFPPGAGVLLAPAALVFHGSFAAISRWAALLGSLVFPLTWIYVKRRNGMWAWPIAILTVCSAPFLDLVTDNPMSDILFLGITLGLLIWVEYWEQAPLRRGPKGWGIGLLGSVLLIAMPATRSIGLVAFGAAALELTIRRVRPRPDERRLTLREAIPFLVSLGIIALWFGGLRRESGYASVFAMVDPMHPDLGRASLAQLIMRPAKGVITELNNAIPLMLPGIPLRLAWSTPALLVIPVILAGWWRELRGPGRFMALYLAGYATFLFFWPFSIASRYLLGVIPLIWICLFDGLEEMVRALRAARSWLRWSLLTYAAGVSVVLLLLLSGLLPGHFGLQNGASLGVWLIVALVLGFAWEPLVRLTPRVPLRGARILASLLAVSFALLWISQAGPRIVKRANGALPLGGPQLSMVEATRWINANLSPDARILTSSTSRIRFATGRPTVELPGTSNPEDYLAIEHRQPQYLLIIENDSTWAMPNDDAKFVVLQRQFPNRWRLVHHAEGASIYAFEPRH